MIQRFFKAVALAWGAARRSEAPAIAAIRLTQPALAEWCAAVAADADALLAAAAAAGVAPEAVKVRADGRDHSLAVVAAGIRYHASQEYPFMVRGGDRFAAIALQATNLNDRFLLMRLRDALPVSLHPALDQLAARLDSMPGLAAPPAGQT